MTGVLHPEPVFFSTLRQANLVRQVEWSAGKTTHTYASNELAGEVAELIDAADDWLVNPTMQRFAAMFDEVGDAVICLDLVALRFNITLPECWTFVEESVTPAERVAHFRDTLIQLAIATGKVCNIVKKLEREELGMPGSRATADDLQDLLGDALGNVDALATFAAIDLGVAVKAKFNKTSEKVGLATRMS